MTSLSLNIIRHWFCRAKNIKLKTWIAVIIKVMQSYSKSKIPTKQSTLPVAGSKRGYPCSTIGMDQNLIN